MAAAGERSLRLVCAKLSPGIASDSDGETGMTGSGSAEFDKLKRYIERTPAVKNELEFAFSSLLEAANPSDRGARFLYGGGAEWIMAGAAWSAGILTAPAGHNANGFDLADLQHDARGLWSVKASASSSSSPIRLTNFMGSGDDAAWVDPTLFVGPYYSGAIFIDPNDPRASDVAASVNKTKDALTLSASAVRGFGREHPENYIPFVVAQNTGTAKTDPAAFAKTFLTPQYFPHLSSMFTAAAPSTAGTTVDEIQRLNVLRKEGALSQSQFDAAVSRVLSD